MAERTIASVLKTVEALRSPGVRIPLSPPLPGGRRKAALSPFCVHVEFSWAKCASPALPPGSNHSYIGVWAQSPNCEVPAGFLALRLPIAGNRGYTDLRSAVGKVLNMVRKRRSAEETRELMVTEGLRQLQDRGIKPGVDHLTLESAYITLDIPRSSSHSAWSIDDEHSPQVTYQRAVLKAWLLERESTMFADSAGSALIELFDATDGRPSDGSIMRTAIQAAFAAGIGQIGGCRSDGDFLTTDLALRFAIASQPPSDRDAEIEEWLRKGEVTNRQNRIEDTYRPLGELLGIRPKAEFGERAYELFAIATASIVEGIGLRHRILPELELDKPIFDSTDGETPTQLVGLCVEAFAWTFFERIPAED